MWRDYRLSLSFANLVYFRAWADLIPLRSDALFTRKAIPGFGLYFALVGDVLAVSLLIFMLLRVAPHLPSWLRRAYPVIAIAMLALATRFLGAHLPRFIPKIVPALFYVLAVFLAAVFSAAATRVIKGISLAATPCLAITFIAPLFYLNGSSPLPSEPPLAHRLPGSPPVRVIWIVFDDWDQRLTFGDFPGDPEAGPAFETGLPGMPTLAFLVNHSFVATRALAAQAGSIPVYDMATIAAIPSLLYGKVAIAYRSEGPTVRRLVFAGINDPTVFGSGDNIFARIRSLGWNSAIAGWYLPYCRLFAPQVTDCFWDEMFDQASSARPEPLRAAVDETRMLFESDMYSPFGRSLVADRHFGEYEALLAAARRYAADPGIGVAFVHLNVPHMPYFDIPGVGHLIHNGPHDDLYIHALRWVDNAVSEVQDSLHKSGLDAKTAIILSSDHPARLISKLAPYVPFIVHLPGDNASMALNQEVSALLSADLVLAIAQGEVRSSEDISKFLIHRQ